MLVWVVSMVSCGVECWCGDWVVDVGIVCVCVNSMCVFLWGGWLDIVCVNCV